MSRPRRVRRAVRLALNVLAWGLLALAVLIGGALVAVDTPPVRRVVATEVTTALAELFRGRITIEQVGGIGLEGVSGVRATLHDPGGRQVLQVSGLDVAAPVVSIVRSVLFGEGDIEVELTRVAVDHADVSLDADPEGIPLLVRSLEPKEAEPAEPGPPGRGVRFVVHEALIGHGWVHGSLGEAPALDVDVTGVGATVAVLPTRASVDVRKVELTTRAMPRGADLRGVAAATLTTPSPRGGGLLLAVRYEGTVGGVLAKARGSLDGDRVDGHVEVPETPGGAFGRLLPEVSLHAPVSATATVSGTLPNLGVHADSRLGPATISVGGRLTLEEPLRASARMDARGFDLRSLGADLPRSSLAARATVDVVVDPSGAVRGTFDVETPQGTLDTIDVPAAMARGGFTETTVDARGTIAEVGAPTDFVVRAESTARGDAVEADVTVRVPDLRRVRRLGNLAGGNGSVRVVGRADLTKKTVSARVQATVRELDRAPVRASAAKLDARVEGALGSPNVDATVHATNLAVADQTFASVVVRAVGTPSHSALRATLRGAAGTPDIDAKAIAELGDVVSLRSAAVSLQRDGSSVTAEADAVRLGQTIRIDGVRISGLGSPVRADVRASSGEIAVVAQAERLDLERLFWMLGVKPRIRGILAFDVDVVAGADSARGRVNVDLSDGEFGKARGTSVRLKAKLEKRRLTAELRSKLGAGHLDLDADDVRLDGPPFERQTWRRSTGRVRLDTNVDLAKVWLLLPDDLLPLGEMAGSLECHAEVARDAPGEPPKLELSLTTERLVLAGKGPKLRDFDSRNVQGPAPWRSTELNADVDLTVGGGSQTDVNVRILDRKGKDLVTLAGRSALPYRDLLTRRGDVLTLLSTVPFEAKVTLPRRKLSAFPAPFRSTRAEGEVELVVNASGTLLEPTVDVDGRGHGIGFKQREEAIPIDGRLTVQYDGRRAEAKIGVNCSGTPNLDGKVVLDIAAKDLLARGRGALAWAGSALVDVEGLPLAAVPQLDDRGVRGKVSGTVEVSASHDRPPRAKVQLASDDFRTATTEKSRARVGATLSEESLDAAVRIDQRGGWADLKAELDLRWKAALQPSVEGVRAALRAKQFRAAAIAPFVQGVAGDVDGRIDADARLDLGGKRGGSVMEGYVNVEKGSFQLPTVGEDFRDVRGRITFLKNGVVRAERLSARGPTGRISASGTARFDGLRFLGASGVARIPKGDPLPVTVEGETLAEASANISLNARPRNGGREIDVEVRIRKAAVELPPKSAHSLQALEPARNLRVGTYRTPGKFFVLPLGPDPKREEESEAGTSLRVALRLEDAEVRREGELRVRLSGTLTIEPGDETRITGQIRLRNGFIDVQGKRFEVESGTITFQGDPKNPEVVVTAGWTAPDGTRVYADFIGPLETGKVTLRSEPTHTKTEILSLILFGTADGESPPSRDGSSPGASAAVGVGSGIATQGLNRALDDLTGLEVATRVDTSDSANPRPELEVRIARDISLALSHVLGVPPPGTNPDKNFATLDWRFTQNWSLETTFGDAGSSIVDVVWQYRY